MMFFLIFLPFAVFAGLMLVTSTAISLLAAAAVAMAIVGRDLIAGRSLKMMAGGTALTFFGVALYVICIDPQASAASVRIAVDGGLLAIALISLAIRCPFTLQYGREVVDREISQLPGFLHANYMITLVWTGAFLLMLLANMLVVYWPTLPFWAAIGIAFGARNCAVYFTRWYPQYRLARAAQQTTQA